jgi:hypothetical protein
MLALEKSLKTAVPVWFEKSQFHFVSSGSNHSLDFRDFLGDQLRDVMTIGRLKILGQEPERTTTVEFKPNKSRTLSDDRRAFDRFLLPPTSSRLVLSDIVYDTLQRQLELYVGCTEEKSLPVVKVVLVGDNSVGKSAFITRLVFGQYSSLGQPTESIEVRQTHFDMFGKRFRVSWLLFCFCFLQISTCLL